MEIIYIGLSILQTIAISLGVGSSTLAIASFFVAIADGKIESDERKMLGVIYVLLRTAMVLIAVTTAILGLIQMNTGVYLSPFILSHWVLIAALFLNAVLMTKHIMPSKFGPSIQAASWYTLGITTALVPLDLAGYSLPAFFIGYGIAIVMVIAIVNRVMAYLKNHQ